MARLVVTLLGGFQASLDSGAAAALPTRKTQALLAYLASEPGRPCPRGALACLLWGEHGDLQARKSLRQAVYALRRAMSAVDGPLLLVEGDGIAVNPTAIEVDVACFRALAAEGSPEALERAATLYRGDFLHGFRLEEPAFEEWLMSERERLRELALAALAALLAHHARTGATERGIQTAVRLLALDPLQEAAHRALMGLYARQGRRAAALRQYRTCVDLLRRELRTEPDAATRALYQALLQGHRGPGGDQAAGGDREADRRPAAPGRRRASPCRPPLSLPEAPLIGRDDELARLRDLVQRAEQGQAHVAIVLGEAGIGKSRLLAEIAAHALERGHGVLLGRAFESERLLAFGPWVAAIRGSHVLDEPGALDVLGPVWRSELARLFPEVGETPGEGGAAQYVRLFEAIARLLSNLAEARPALVILEDLHWADELSIRLLAYVGRRCRGCKLLIAGSAREEELE